jgi:hypothetical protein
LSHLLADTASVAASNGKHSNLLANRFNLYTADFIAGY